MHNSDLAYFSLLKEKVASTFLQRYAASDQDISKWKGEDITAFQDDLMDKVRGGISEKWFYTHIKSSSEKLPRIDMLNMLSKYAGYDGWADFQQQHELPKENANRESRSKLRPLAIAVLFLIAVVAAVKLWPEEYQCLFCFVDAYRKAPVSESLLEVIVLNEGESPRTISADSAGCFALSTNEEKLRFVVQSPYYKTDTIVRTASAMAEAELVSLRTNDYAWMIHLFANAQVEDWKKRRAQLDEMIADEARIYQIYEAQSTYMALYNKEEFIDKLTMPTQSLKNIEIVETIYAKDQIMVMRFIQRTPSNNSDE